MKRSKKVVFVCHCLLNQNARAQGVEKCESVVKEFIGFCLKNDYGIISIECPQLLFEPLVRRPATKEVYDNEKCRSVCKKIAEDVIRQIKIYLKNSYQIEGIFGVEGSPTCAAVRTHVLSPEGKSIGKLESGVFIDELKEMLKRAKLKIKIFDWDIQAKKPLISNFC